MMTRSAATLGAPRSGERMIRRVVNLLLLLASGGLMLYAGASAAEGSRRPVVVCAIAGLGAVCNLVGVVRAELPIRAWLRNLAAFVALLFVGGALAAAYMIETDALPHVARDDIATREDLVNRVSLLRWGALAATYAAVALFALPVRRPAPPPDLLPRPENVPLT